MRLEPPELSEYQLDCLQRFVRFELPIETLAKVSSAASHPHIGRSCHPSISGVLCWHSEESSHTDTRRHRFRHRKGENWQSYPALVAALASMLLLNDAFDWSGEDEDAIADMLADLAS
jgi:hypothetical protein